MKRILGHMSWPKLVVFAMVLVGILAGFAIMVTAQPGFCNSCHIMNDYYESWEESSHHEVSCLSCHLNPGFGSYMRGKINGFSQSIDCVLGRIGTKANATVQDVSCLRSSCHNAEELKSKPVDFDGKKFTHDKHIGEVIDGINVTCGTCHAHFGGEESVESIAALLRHDALREDARMVLERIPGGESLTSLRNALESVPEDFRLNIAQSLRARGEAVDPEKYPCRKLVPTK